jgi:hypothetical protein
VRVHTAFPGEGDGYGVRQQGVAHGPHSGLQFVHKANVVLSQVDYTVTDGTDGQV